MMPPAALLKEASISPDRARWIEAFRRVRGETERRAAPLSAEDQAIQSMPDASPAKWHRAHTTWFFETFLIQPHDPGYKVFDQRFGYLFNSYYVAAGPRHARPKRGLITRPDAGEVAAYRAHVDAAVEALIAEASAAALPEILRILEIGLNHEEQHQELLLTDILHAFAQNPTAPAYDANWRAPRATANGGYVELPEGIHTIGHQTDGYCFDNEGPSHRVLVGPVRIARALVNNG
jgi:ergothioneine biosynthesis protein EgtB